MWSNVISVDKQYGKEINYVLNKLGKMTDLSYAVEESEKRIWIYLASACEMQDVVESELYDVFEVVFLSFFKLRFFRERLPLVELNHSTCALLSSMLHFDKIFEQNIIDKMLSGTLDYNLDGLYNFRMRALKDAWQEVTDVAARLLEGAESERDMFDIASFIAGSEGKKNRLELCGGVLTNVTERRIVEIQNLYDDDELNLLDAIIREKTSEIVIVAVKISTKMQSTLRNIVKVTER